MAGMATVKGFNLVAAFLLELAMLAAFALWGWSVGTSTPVRILLAVLVPAAVMVVWGLALAPRAPRRLPRPWLEVAKVVLFVQAGVGLAAAGHGRAATALVAGFLVSLSLAVRWDQQDVTGHR